MSMLKLSGRESRLGTLGDVRVTNPSQDRLLMAVTRQRGGEIFGVGTQGGRHDVPLPWAILFRPDGASAGWSPQGIANR